MSTLLDVTIDVLKRYRNELDISDDFFKGMEYAQSILIEEEKISEKITLQFNDFAELKISDLEVEHDKKA